MKPEFQKLCNEVVNDYGNVITQMLIRQKQIGMIDEYIDQHSNYCQEALNLCYKDRAEYQKDLERLEVKKRDYEEIAMMCAASERMFA